MHADTPDEIGRWKMQYVSSIVASVFSRSKNDLVIQEIGNMCQSETEI
jgi:hypothetical protein